jgi:hypothetical protein
MTPTNRTMWMRDRGLAALVIVVVALTLGGALLSMFLLSGGGATGKEPRAAIIDQLALTDPNPQFVANATRELRLAGYTVDYVPAQSVTVNFYRSLPARGYSFIVLRSHTSDYQAPLDAASASKPPVSSVGLFTNELYSTTTHVDDQRATRLMVDWYADRDIPWRYFGITPSFILNSTRGRFDGTTVVLMGCSGLETNDLAQAFLARGAKTFVSWDRPVTAEHTDAATADLMTNIFSNGLDVHEAVAKTMEDVGSDPSFGSRLAVFP